MHTFTLYLQDAIHSEQIDKVESFVGEDASGSFGILAGHGRMMTSLVFGLARFRAADRPWEYLALPGAVLYFVNNRLYVSTRRYLRDANFDRISEAMERQLVAEEENLRNTKEQLHHMEEAVLKRLWQIGRETG
jgi:F-type H+-transporting ATPase subunit epsilon